MTKTLTSKRLLLGIATIASEVTNPNPTAGAAGSLWLRQGNGSSTPTQIYLNLTGDATNWQLQNLTNLSVFNVKFYGAVGDGVTDDTAAINAAVSAATASGIGGVIYFPPGTFRVTRPVSGVGSIQLTNAHDLVFLGDGFASRISMIGSALLGDWYMFRLRNSTSRIKFINLSFTSAITEPDPGSQNHFLQISGVAGDALGGTTDVDIVGCYFGTVPGAAVRTLGESGEVVKNIRVLYNDFDMISSRSCVEAQRFVETVDVSYNYLAGSHDQQIDFEPTGTGGPSNWSIIANHFNQTTSPSTVAMTLSGAGNSPIGTVNLRCLAAYNTITQGGSIEGVKGLVNADIIGNVITVDKAGGTAPIDFGQRVEGSNFLGNICINIGTVNNFGIRIIAAPGLTGALATNNVVAENIVTAFGSGSNGIAVSATTNTLVSGNLILMTLSATGTSVGIAAVAVTEDLDHIAIIGNLLVGITSAIRIGINLSCSSSNQHNLLCNWNYVRLALQIITMDKNSVEQFLDWRSCVGNNGVAITTIAIAGPTNGEGSTIEGNAGPGGQVVLIQVSGGPEGFVTAPVGAVGVNQLGAQGLVLWMKETGVGLSGGKTGWVQQGADELVFGVLDAGTGTAARFLPPGSGAPSVLTTEIKWAVPRPGTVRNLKVACVAGTGVATVTYSLRKNAAAAANVNIANTATSANSANTFTVVAGDLLSMQVTRTAIVAAGQTAVVLSFELTT